MSLKVREWLVLDMPIDNILRFPIHFVCFWRPASTPRFPSPFLIPVFAHRAVAEEPTSPNVKFNPWITHISHWSLKNRRVYELYMYLRGGNCFIHGICLEAISIHLYNYNPYMHLHIGAQNKRTNLLLRCTRGRALAVLSDRSKAQSRLLVRIDVVQCVFRKVPIFLCTVSSLKFRVFLLG